MAIDWEAFEKDVDGLVRDAGKRTDDKLAARISSVSRLTDDEIKDMFPKSADAKKLAELMQVVRSAGGHNEKINHIVKNIESLSEVIFAVLKKVA
jgi:hypothetical protein